MHKPCCNKALLDAHVHGELVSISSIENHIRLENIKNFNPKQKYKVWFNGDKGKNRVLLNAFILLLGSKYIHISTYDFIREILQFLK